MSQTLKRGRKTKQIIFDNGHDLGFDLTEHFESLIQLCQDYDVSKEMRKT